MDVKVFTVFHKAYWEPKDELYAPVQVGFSNSFGILRDNTGDNIAEKNRSFCEMTAAYWVWKNCRCDYVGLDHYRRHFSKRKFGDKKSRVLTKVELDGFLSPDIVILPKKRHYWIETSWSQYAHAHHEVDLVYTRNIISEKYPDYLRAFDTVMNKTSGHRFNMFIMPWHVYDSYCSWVFDILFSLERCLDVSSYNDYDSRVFGFVAERLLDVYVLKNRIKYKEFDYVFLDKECWGKKITSFLKRKFHIGIQMN